MAEKKITNQSTTIQNFSHGQHSKKANTLTSFVKLLAKYEKVSTKFVSQRNICIWRAFIQIIWFKTSELRDTKAF